MIDQIRLRLYTRRLLCANPSEYKPERSCNTVVLKGLEDIRPVHDKCNLTILVIIDFSKVFTAKA